MELFKCVGASLTNLCQSIGEGHVWWNHLVWVSRSFFKLGLLGWRWLIKLYRFPMYNSIIHHLYIVLCVCHPKSSVLLSTVIPSLPSSTSPHPPFPWVITILLPVSIRFFFLCFIPSPFSPIPLWVGLKWQIHSNTQISISFWIPSSTLNHGRLSISDVLTVGHLLVCDSANQTNC